MTLPFKSSPFVETQVVSCKDVEEGTPRLVGDVFSEQDSQVCVVANARFEDNATELLDFDDKIGFTFVWTREGEVIANNLVTSPVGQNLWVVASDCRSVGEDALSKGRYQVVVMQDDIDVGEIEFRIE